MNTKDVIITITLKGEKSKKYFLDKMSKSLGVRFAKIPKEELVIEEQGDSKISVELFKDLLFKNLIDEVEFKVCTPLKPAAEKVSSPIKVPNKKRLGCFQKKVLEFMMKHKGEKFSINSLSSSFDYKFTETHLEQILESLLKRNLIAKKKTDKDDYVYFYILSENSDFEEVDKKQETAEMEMLPPSNPVPNAVTIEQKKAEAITKQTPEIKKILELFVTSKYIHILNEIFKNTVFNVEAIRNKSDFADKKALTEVISVLDEEAIQYDAKNDGTYCVDNAWRTYALIRLGNNDAKSEDLNKVAELLLDKGLIYEGVDGTYNII